MSLFHKMGSTEKFQLLFLFVLQLLTGAVVHIVPYFYPSQLRDSVSSQQTATESIESCQKSPGANDMNRHKLQPGWLNGQLIGKKFATASENEFK